MRMRIRSPGPHATAALFLLLACGSVAPPLAGQSTDTRSAYDVWYDALRELQLDPERGAHVSNVTLEKDAGRFHLDEGQIQLLEPVDGRTMGAVFVGQGRFELSAPDPIERGQLHRAFQSEQIDLPFRGLVMLFTDFTLSELGDVDWEPMEPHDDAEREAHEARDYFSDDDGWASRRVMLPLMNNGVGFFYAHFSEDRDEPTIFSVDPHHFEEVTLSQRAHRAKAREVVAQFHRQADYTSGRSMPQEGLDLISVSTYDIHTTIDEDLDVVGRATLDVIRIQNRYDWIPFRLYFDLQVDSARWGDGSNATFHRPKESSDLWLDYSTAPSESTTLTFHYSGELMDKPNDLWVQLGSHTSWYPVYEFGRQISYSLTFVAPEDYLVTTVGTRTTSVTEDERTTTTWETGPVRSLTFNIGEFEPHESAPPQEGDPGLQVLVNERAHQRLGALVEEDGGFLLEQRNMAEMVAFDLRNSFTFFNGVYGPTQVRDFVATEIPYNHGEAYPGLVMLAWSTVQWTDAEGYDEMFRAHEVAHQWWGIGVRPATYRDWWLAEGFSEFSGWWYAARARGSIDMYMKRLEETREEILDRRGEAAPIVLGQRAGTSRDPEDYETIVYNKGAWVLHMLRTLLTDPDTGNDDAFTEVMKTFYTKHLGGTATTASFQETAEEVTGTSLDWFFQQWVYGTDIPTYTFSHRYTPQADGSVIATVRVRQEGVPDGFQMVVPIHLDFGEEGSATLRLRVVGAETEAQLPLLPREPNAITFNPFESVLAETRTEDWRD